MNDNDVGRNDLVAMYKRIKGKKVVLTQREKRERKGIEYFQLIE